MENQEKILAAMEDNFKDCYSEEGVKKYFSPYRVNICGEHLDYNGGVVLPCALDEGTYALVADRTDNKTRIFSMNMADRGVIEFTMSGNKYDTAKDWANYPIGVVDVFEKAGYKATHGFDIVLYGTLPNGAGLSSSASIEVLMAVILNDAFNFGIDMIEMVKMSQKAENEFVGVNCGIMDQFSVGLGKKNCAILLDCNTLNYSYAPLILDGYSIVITNTNKKHSLSSSAYNERRQQCENALKKLQTVKPDLKYLCDLTREEFDKISDVIDDPIERKRARHAVYENQRTLEAVEKLKQGDLVAFGKLLNDSHISLRDDYDVTGEELDTLAELAWKQEGVLGSRMTGAGFGGCTISIVKNEAIEDFKKNISSGYTKKIGYEPSFYVANIADGTHRID